MQLSPTKRGHLLKTVCTILCLGTMAIYAPVRHFDFVRYDDGDYITKNQHVLGGLTGQDVIWSFTHFRSNNWHPLTWMSHMLDVTLWGLSAGGHHVTNVVLHTANAVLLFLVLTRMTGAFWQSAFVAAIFAWHPLHVESVAWISERKDVLSTFFWILTIWAYAWNVRQPTLSRRALMISCFVLGLMSKPMLVTLPFVLMLLDYWPLGRAGSFIRDGRKWSFLLFEKVPLLVLTIASSVITFRAQRDALISLDRMPFSIRLGNAPLSYTRYFVNSIWPTNLAVFYPVPDSIPKWQVAGSILFLAVASVVVFFVAKRLPYLLTGWLWFLGALVPVIGFVQVGDQARADRYMYVPLIGLSIIVAWGVPQMVSALLASSKLRRITLTVASAAVLIACLTVTVRQLTYWQDTLRLFQHALAVTSDNWFAHGNVAISLGNKGNIPEAMGHYRELLRIKPASIEGLNNLAWYLASYHDERYRNGAEALTLAERALELSADPDPGTLDTLAVALAENHRFAEAIQKAEQARALALSQGNTELAGRIGERLKLYEQGLTYRM